MADEIFDVVNEKDEVIGSAPRDEVHAQRLRHRAVHVLIYNSKGEVFLQKRSMTKDTHPGVWDSSASGHLDQGEDYDACAMRETEEELGLRLENLPERLFKIDACDATDMEFIWIYRGQAEGPFTLHPEEIEMGEWVAPIVLEYWMEEKPWEFAPAFVLLWSRLNR